MPTAGAGPRPRRRVSRKALIGLLVAAGVLLFALANLHLVYVAVTSQPECVVPRADSGQATVQFQPAKPAC